MKVTFSEAELAGVDSVRGQVPRATWVRERVRDVLAVSGVGLDDPAPPVTFRSPVVAQDFEPSRGPSPQQLLEEQRQAEAGEF